MTIQISQPGVDGLLFAGLGAYVSTLWWMIGRINANALTARFLTTSALRSAIALILGVSAGQIGLFGFVNAGGAQDALYFLVGFFTSWAIGALRQRARGLFQVDEAGCESLPLCLVDGLDDQIIEYLEELGIHDVQHLATSDPGELTIRSLYPLNRVIDWVDQAILIGYLRRNITAARQLGIRGAIDLMVIYDAAERPADGAPTEPSQGPAQSPIQSTPTVSGSSGARPGDEDAKKILQSLAQKTNMSYEALKKVGSSLWYDYTVDLIYRLWQREALTD